MRTDLECNEKKKRKQLILGRSLIARTIFLLRTLIITCIKHENGKCVQKKWELPEQEALRKTRERSRKTGVHRPKCIVQMGLGLR